PLLEISPATMARPVVTSTSHATRLIGSCAMSSSSTESEIWSAILSGWPSVTDSDVNRWRAPMQAPRVLRMDGGGFSAEGPSPRAGGPCENFESVFHCGEPALEFVDARDRRRIHAGMQRQVEAQVVSPLHERGHARQPPALARRNFVHIGPLPPRVLRRE